jgi:hypothetical protein
MNKKVKMVLFLILGLIILTSAFIYFLNKRSVNQNKTPATNTQNPDSNSGNNSGGNNAVDPDAAERTESTKKLTKLTDSAVVSPALSYDAKAMWYFTTDSKLNKHNLETGLKQEYVLPDHPKVDAVIWPSSGNDFIIVSNETGSNLYYFYNSQNQTITPYPNKIRWVDFMPDGKHIIYNWVENGKSTLSIADSNTGNHHTISDLPDPGMAIKVSSQGNKAFAYNPGSASDGKLDYIPFEKSKIILIKTGSNNAVLWSPNGQNFVFNKLDPNGDNNGQLWLGDITNAQDKPLGLNTTANKTIFDSKGDNFFLAVPSIDSGDAVWEINTQTLTKKRVYLGNSGSLLDISNMQYANNESGEYLYFKNSDGSLYSLKLK